MDKIIRIGVGMNGKVFNNLNILWKFNYCYGLETVHNSIDAWYYLELLKVSGFTKTNSMKESEI